jgi:hypothetical protein
MLRAEEKNPTKRISRKKLPADSKPSRAGGLASRFVDHALIIGRALRMPADPGELRKDRIAIEFDRSLPHGFLFFEDDLGNRRNHKPMMVHNLLLELGLCPSRMADKPP